MNTLAEIIKAWRIEAKVKGKALYNLVGDKLTIYVCDSDRFVGGWSEELYWKYHEIICKYLCKIDEYRYGIEYDIEICNCHDCA